MIKHSLEKQENNKDDDNYHKFAASKIFEFIFTCGTIEDEKYNSLLHAFSYFLSISDKFQYNVGFLFGKIGNFKKIEEYVNEYLEYMINEWNSLEKNHELEMKELEFIYDDLYELIYNNTEKTWKVGIQYDNFYRLANLSGKKRTLQVIKNKKVCYTASQEFSKVNTETLWEDIQKTFF